MGVKFFEFDFIGEVFLRCVVKDVVFCCGDVVIFIVCCVYGFDIVFFEIKIVGYFEVNFLYIFFYFEYIIGEFFWNFV